MSISRDESVKPLPAGVKEIFDSRKPGVNFTKKPNSWNADSLPRPPRLADIQLRAVAEGTISISPNELVLAKDQVVTLDPNSRIGLESGATVKADGEMRVYAPSIAPQPSAKSAKTPSAAITNFTIFKQVAFDKGFVMTGWKFLTSAQKTPSSQYCYYTESSENSGLDVVVSIAEDMKLEAPKTTPKNFNLSEAFERCVWFRTQ